jgi:hypothetical protein
MQLQQLSRCFVLHNSVHHRMLGSDYAVTCGAVFVVHAACQVTETCYDHWRLLPHSGCSMAYIVAVLYISTCWQKSA